MGWFTKKEENPTYDFFAEQAKLLGITYESTVPESLGLFTKAYEKYGADPKFAQTGLQFSYDMLPDLFGIPSKTIVQGFTPEGGSVTDTIAGGLIGKLKDPEWQGENIDAMLSVGEKVPGVYEGNIGTTAREKSLLGLIERMSGASSTDLEKFLGSYAGLLGISPGGGLDDLDLSSVLDVVDDKEIPWT